MPREVARTRKVIVADPFHIRKQDLLKTSNLQGFSEASYVPGWETSSDKVEFSLDVEDRDRSGPKKLDCVDQAW